MQISIKRIQSKDSAIRIDVFRREDRLFMFIEETLYAEGSETFWAPTYQSGLYENQFIAEREAEARLNSKVDRGAGTEMAVSKRAEAQPTGYFVDAKKQIVGPSGPTGFYLDENKSLLKNGQKTGVYIEDGHFFKTGRRIFWLFSACSPTGHVLTSDGLIVGSSSKLPWQDCY